MAQKLSGLLAIMAFMLLVATWCVRTVLGLPAMEPEQVLAVGLVVIVVYHFLLGRIVAWIGIRLVQELLAEKRAQREAMRFEAQRRDQEMVQQIVGKNGKAADADAGAKNKEDASQ